MHAVPAADHNRQTKCCVRTEERLAWLSEFSQSCSVALLDFLFNHFLQPSCITYIYIVYYIVLHYCMQLLMLCMHN